MNFSLFGKSSVFPSCPVLCGCAEQSGPHGSRPKAGHGAHTRSPRAATLALVLTLSLCQIAQAAPNREIPPASAEQMALVDAAIPQAARVKPKAARLVLVTARTEGFYHDSIPVGLHAFKQLGERTGAFRVEFDHEMSAFTAENLKRFDAVLFLSTSRLAFEDPAARAALLGFIEGGKGMVGIHAASDNFYTWPEGQRLMGGVFHNHPWLWNHVVAVKLDEPAHPLNAAFGGQGFWIRDEIYQIVGPYGRDQQRVLMSLDMARPENERPAAEIVRQDRDFPIGWLKNHGRGRVFYSSLGHNADVFATPEVLQHWLDGVQFAVGDLEAPAMPSTTLQPAPTPALAPALPRTLLERGPALREAAAAFSPSSLDAVATHTSDRDPAALHHISAALRDPSPAARATARTALGTLAARRDLTPEATLAVIGWLGEVGDASAVPALAAWGRKADTADAAIRALLLIPGGAADRALTDLLKTAPAAHRISAAGALGERRVAGAVKPIAGLLKSTEAREVSAALSALSRIASKDALASLSRFKAPAALASDHAWALLHAARVLELDGDTAGALKLVQQTLPRPGLSDAQRVAAHVSWLRLDSAAALPKTAALLPEPYVGVRLARPWLVAALAAPTGEPALGALAAGFGKLPPSLQLTLLTQAGELATPKLAPLVRAGLSSTAATVRHAGFLALAMCGSLDDAATLIDALGQPDDRPAASAALERHPDAALDARLRKAMTGAAPDVQAALLLILGNRLDREAMPLMVAAASGAERAPRAAGIRGLAALARGEDLPLILSLRSQLQPADRRHWQEALRAAVRGRNDVPETVAMLRAEIDAASPAERPAFLGAIIGFETPESLAAVRELLAVDDLERRKEMVRSLASARNQTSFDLLIDVAEKDSDLNTRTLALRGYLDTLALRRDRWSETMQGYDRAGRAALRQEERDAAIAALNTHFQGSQAEKIIAELKALPAPGGS